MVQSKLNSKSLFTFPSLVLLNTPEFLGFIYLEQADKICQTSDSDKCISILMLNIHCSALKGLNEPSWAGVFDYFISNDCLLWEINEWTKYFLW